MKKLRRRLEFIVRAAVCCAVERVLDEGANDEGAAAKELSQYRDDDDLTILGSSHI